jgi:DNA polymerase I-like protein with 3'-5' exonuclease and polymerase domains
MNSRSGTKSGAINQETDLRTFLGSLTCKSFAISPPVEFGNSLMMGVANEDLQLCIHLPLSALSQVATLLFTTGDENTPIYVHSLKQIINWFHERNILIPTDRCRDMSLAAYLLKPPEGDKGEDWQEFLLSSLVRDHFGREYPFLPRLAERTGYPEIIYEHLSRDASSIWALGAKLIPELQSDPQLHRLYTDVEMPLVSVLAEMEREGIGG